MSTTTVELRSLIASDDELRLTLEDVAVAAPAPDEVVVRVEAAPLNPSDLGMLLGPADLATLSTGVSSGRPLTTAKIQPQFASRTAARAGKSLPVGLEGAGVVVGAGENAKHLIGRVVGTMAMRCTRAIASFARPTFCSSPKASRRNRARRPATRDRSARRADAHPYGCSAQSA